MRDRNAAVLQWCCIPSRGSFVTADRRHGARARSRLSLPVHLTFREILLFFSESELVLHWSSSSLFLLIIPGCPTVPDTRNVWLGAKVNTVHLQGCPPTPAPAAQQRLQPTMIVVFIQNCSFPPTSAHNRSPSLSTAKLSLKDFKTYKPKMFYQILSVLENVKL